MKTAEEMYQFCQDTGFFSGSDRQWGVRLFSVLEKQLRTDEEVLICFIGLHNRTSATKNDGFYAYALTDQRFILGQKKLIGDDFKVIPLTNLQDLRLTKVTSLDILEIASLEGTIKQSRTTFKDEGITGSRNLNRSRIRKNKRRHS